ncbi:MAG: carboxypeptidase regulatory-like domain-containing protein [Acidobacteriota bacterium]
MLKKVLTFLLILTLPAPLFAQASTGTLAGTVTDQAGAVVVNATVTLTNRTTKQTRIVNTGNDGIYSAASLPAGTYDVTIEAAGFSTVNTTAEISVGATTTLNVPLQVGGKSERIDIQGAAANINLESNTIQGVITRTKIENLPLNGRSFLNLAQLEPGVTVAAGNPAQFNAQFNVSVLGGPASHTSITVDGGNIRNPIEGGTGQNFSQEVVQEFQLSSTNFDLSTGITAFGAINVVTRQGGNDYHGAGYFYFRDHNMAAYPSLARNSFTAEPFFARRQGGFWIGGPIKKDKLQFFFNFENTNQSGVYIVQPDLPSVAEFGTIATAPYRGKQTSVRLDYTINPSHSAFLRYSHDGNTNAGPFGIPVPPSNFVSNKNFVDQSLLGVTSLLGPNVVNDFRFSYFYWQNRNIPAPCDGDINRNCLGAGGPEVFYLNSVNFALGNNFNSPQGRDLRRFPLSDNVSWQKGAHRIKFGGEWEHFTGTGYWGFFDPARVYLLSPEFLAAINPILPTLFGLPDGKIHNFNDLKKLPVVAFLLGIGDRAQPSYKLENAKVNDRFHFYAQDTWKVTPKFTFNYGVGWEHETNVLNHDLPKPAYIAPIYGPDLNPTEKQYKNFSPALGFAWSLGKNDRTVIRGGVGVFYDTQLGWWRLGERAVIGGSGRQFIGNNAVARITGTGNFTSSYLNTLTYNYGTFLAQLPALRAQQDAKYPGTGDQPQILLSKQANALGALYPQDFPTTQAQHFNLGIQHEMFDNLVVQADIVHRHMIHGTPGGFFGASVDYNKFNSIGGPIIPRCASTAQANDPTAQCSAGPINFWWPGATSKYTALLLKVDKRFSSRYQFTASYAFQNSKSVLDVTQNLNNFFATYGADLPRHNLNISGIVSVPWDIQVSLLSAFSSHPPVALTIPGFNDAGTDVTSSGYSSLTYLLGKEYSGFISKNELHALVSEYNLKYSGQLTPAGKAGVVPNQKYPFITLPNNFALGDLFSSQDLRVTKNIKFGERVGLRLIGEVFNLFNVSNLTNFNFNLLSPASFGKPNQRVGQTFGSGGPRAFQFGVRLAF